VKRSQDKGKKTNKYVVRSPTQPSASKSRGYRSGLVHARSVSNKPALGSVRPKSIYVERREDSLNSIVLPKDLLDRLNAAASQQHTEAIELIAKLLAEALDDLEKTSHIEDERRIKGLLDYGSTQLRAIATERGLDWDSLSDQDRETMIDEILHEV
jgi:hypothetical protein